MKLSLKHIIMTIILIAALLATLAVGILKIEAGQNAPAQPRVSHALAWYCPPPPIPC